MPDRLRLARFYRIPELGPKILFFSGGSALNPLSRFIIDYTHNSIHLITPFDSGGSSAKLRRAFGMPAVGDLRNRLMALSDQSIKGNPEVVELFSYRLPKDLARHELEQILDDLVRGEHDLVAAVPDPFRKIIRAHIGFFQKEMPENFDLAGASVGNLVLTGGYLNNDRHLDPVVYLFAKLAEVRGVVRPVLNQDVHLAARLTNGRTLVGQHLLTGREVPPIEAPVAEVFLTEDRHTPQPVLPSVRPKIQRLISEAELICYPMGSFYSSVVANLLPRGVVEAVAANECPKVFIPNTGHDKEAPGVSVEETVARLLEYLRQGQDRRTPVRRLLEFVLLDLKKGAYPSVPDVKAIEKLGLTVIDADLVTPGNGTDLDPGRLAGILLSLV